jgi:hypothetical protein
MIPVDIVEKVRQSWPSEQFKPVSSPATSADTRGSVEVLSPSSRVAARTANAAQRFGTERGSAVGVTESLVIAGEFFRNHARYRFSAEILSSVSIVICL